MSSSVRDKSGASAERERSQGQDSRPVAQDSLGLPPVGFRLPSSTSLGPVLLQVADLERALDYYREVLGLQLLDREGEVASLGTLGGEPLIELRERRGVRPQPGGRTGLFHFALLLPDRPSLGRFARHLEQLGVGPGAADHLVSEALYLRDPDHLGIEVYADRPRSAWQRVGRELVMTTDPLDRAGLLAEAGDEPWLGMPAGTIMGHVHLSVGSLGRAADYYSEGLGFDRMVWSYPGALFLAAGGYHHHLGTNVWAGRDARPAGDDEAQLLEWTLRLPASDDLEEAADSLTRAGHSVRRIGSANNQSAVAHDPWGSTVRLTAAT